MSILFLIAAAIWAIAAWKRVLVSEDFESGERTIIISLLFMIIYYLSLGV